ncbi:hypothetical protein [Kordia sp.]
MNFKPINCPKCNLAQPRIRKPKGWKEILWGGNTCENCSCKMDRLGKERS